MGNIFEGALTGAVSEAADFGEGAFHSAIENPYNGLTQIVNKMGASLPEMHLVDEHKDSLGFKAGNIAGMAADFYFLNKAGQNLMGNLGGAGLGGTMLRAGLVGGFYEGVLTPSDANSKNFFGDRLSSAAVGATTFGAMAGTASLLGRTGWFLVPEAQTLMQTMTFNGLTGVSAGLAHAEASAIFKQGKALASASDFLSDGLTYGAFGAAFGAIDYGYNKFFHPLAVTTVKSDKGSIDLFKNEYGEVVKIESKQPSITREGMSIETMAAKNTLGQWRITDTKAFYSDGSAYSGDTLKPAISGVTQAPDGAVKVELQGGDWRIFRPEGQYEYSSQEGRESAARWRQYESDRLNKGMTDVDGNVSKTLDVGGNMKGGLDWDKSGVLQKAWLSDGPSFERTGPGSWKVLSNNAEYTWQGEINAVTAPEGRLQAIELLPKGGQPVRFMPSVEAPVVPGGTEVAKPAQPATDLIGRTAQFIKYNDGYGYLRVGEDGSSLFLKGSRWDVPSVNGTQVGLQEMPLKAGDSFTIRSDVGDRYPEYESYKPKWGTTPEGGITLNGKVLIPNAMIDLHDLRANR